MNIIYIVNFHIYKSLTSLPTVGGIEVTTMDIIDELRVRGHNLWIPSQQKEKPNWVEQGLVDIITASSFDPLTFFHILYFKNKFGENAAIVQHAHTTYQDLKGNILPDLQPFNKLLKLWVRILYSQAHLLITPSDYAKTCIENIQKSRTYPIRSVSSGIIIDKFEYKNSFRYNFRKFLSENYDVPPDAIIILNVGLTWKRKRVDTFKKVAESLPEYYFVWVGPVNENPDVEDAKKLENIIFTGFYDDIREPYYGADVFLNTSDEENLCLPLIEASLCNLPVVARDIEVFNWLKHNYSFYKAKTVEDFIEGLKKIIYNNNYRSKLVENACKIAKKRHDFRDTVDTIEKYFTEALKIKEIWDKR